jgi:hypothetical protein
METYSKLTSVDKDPILGIPMLIYINHNVCFASLLQFCPYWSAKIPWQHFAKNPANTAKSMTNDTLPIGFMGF